MSLEEYKFGDIVLMSAYMDESSVFLYKVKLGITVDKIVIDVNRHIELLETWDGITIKQLIARKIT
jgi:hypothetical protein